MRLDSAVIIESSTRGGFPKNLGAGYSRKIKQECLLLDRSRVPCVGSPWVAIAILKLKKYIVGLLQKSSVKVNLDYL